MFGVLEKSSVEWIGRIGPRHPLHWPTREVDWGLRKGYWGKGYAFEAAAAFLNYAFDNLGWGSVTYLIADKNVMSQKLAARLGSKPGEYVNLPGSLSDVRLCVWSQTKEDWIRSKNRIYESFVLGFG